MTAPILLPSNATGLERTLETILLGKRDVAASISRILTCKEAPADNWLMWLVWEYGLEELLQFLPDPRRVLEVGIEWQRIRGTPASLVQGLSWIGTPSNAYVEEEETGGAHWFEFMLNSGYVPNGPFNVRQLVDLSRVSAPAGTRLSRIFHGYDIRRFKLDQSEWGDLLSDYSGWRHPELGVVLSFGRSSTSTIDLSGELLARAVAQHSRWHTADGRYDDRPLLDNAFLFGEVALPNHPATLIRQHVAFNGIMYGPWPDGPWPDGVWMDNWEPSLQGETETQQATATRWTWEYSPAWPEARRWMPFTWEDNQTQAQTWDARPDWTEVTWENA